MKDRQPPSFSTSFLQIDGKNVEILQSSGNGIALLLFHANSSAANSFAALLESQLGQQHRLIAVSFPGHGNSAPANDIATYTIAALGAWAARVVDALNLPQYVLVGQSLGGHAILEALDQFPTALGLVLLSAPPISNTTLATAFLPDEANGALFRSVLSEAQLDVLGDCFSSQLDASQRARWRENARKTDHRFRPALGASLKAGQLQDECLALANCKIPVAMLVGTQDRFLSQAYYHSLPTTNLWQGQPIYFDGQGHLLHIEAPAKFEQVLTQFLQHCTAAAQDVSA